MRKALLFFLLQYCFAIAVSGEDNQVFDGGIGFPNSVVIHDFTIENPSQSPLAVKNIRVNCSCVSTDLHEMTIQAKEKAVYRVALHAGPIAGDLIGQMTFDKEVDGILSTSTASIAVKAVDYLGIPNEVIGVPHQGVEIDFIKTEHPDVWDGIEIQIPESEGKLNARIERASPKVWHFSAIPEQNGIDSGVFRFNGKLVFSNRGIALPHQMALKLSTRVSGGVSAVPSYLVFGAVRAGESREKKFRIVLNKNIGGLKILTMTETDPNRIEIKAEPGDDSFQNISVKFTAGADKRDAASGEIAIRLSNGEVLHVPYAASVVPFRGNLVEMRSR